MISRRKFFGGVLASAVVSSLIPYRITDVGSSVNSPDKYAVLLDKLTNVDSYYRTMTTLGEYETMLDLSFSENELGIHHKNTEDLFSFMAENFDPTKTSKREVNDLLNKRFSKDEILSMDSGTLLYLNEGTVPVAVLYEMINKRNIRFDARILPSFQTLSKSYSRIVLEN